MLHKSTSDGQLITCYNNLPFIVLYSYPLINRNNDSPLYEQSKAGVGLILIQCNENIQHWILFCFRIYEINVTVTDRFLAVCNRLCFIIYRCH